MSFRPPGKTAIHPARATRADSGQGRRKPPGSVMRVKMMLHDLYISGAEKFQRVFINAVGDVINEAGDAGVDERFRAVDAREMGHVAGAAAG